MVLIVMLGINHNTAALKTREKAAFTDGEKQRAAAWLQEKGSSGQAVFLSTCNRTEVYALAENPTRGRRDLLAMLGAVKGLTADELAEATYFYSGPAAVAHLFRVTAGLDSMVLGETQIAGQVREAYAFACANGAAGKEIHGLFQHAARCSKRVQGETGINDHSLSVSYLAVEMIREELGSFAGLTVLVLGSGEMARLSLEHLREMGAGEIIITGRTAQRAEELARLCAGKTVDYACREAYLHGVDIVIGSTAAPHAVLGRVEIAAAMARRPHRPLFLIDLAVPRDFDAAAGNIDNVYLYDLDSLQEKVERNRDQRRREAAAAEEIVAAESEAFCAWFRTLGVAPLIEALRRKAEAIREAETERCLERKLWRLSDKEKLAVENLTRSLVNALLREPIIKLKDEAAREREEQSAAVLGELFSLQEERGSSEDDHCREVH